MHLFLKFIFGIKLYMFRAVPLSIVRSFSLYTQQWYMSFHSIPSWSCSQALWHIPLLCVQWKTPDDGQRNCPKHVEFYSKNKFEKLVHLVGFITRLYHAARSPECQKPNRYWISSPTSHILVCNILSKASLRSFLHAVSTHSCTLQNDGTSTDPVYLTPRGVCKLR